jgi:hypothetical protein
MSKIFVSHVFILLSLVIVPTTASAATVFFDPPTRELSERDTMLVPIRLEVKEGECINAADVEIKFDPSAVAITDVSRGESILSLWTEAPEIDREQGLVRFSGGLPGGFCGRIIGDPGETNVLASLAVSALPESAGNGPTPTTLQFLERSKILLNDGTGTPAELAAVALTLTLIPGDGTADDEWLEVVRNDATAPELFDIVLMSHPSVEQGKWTIAFSTTDKQSGIDRYEVLEADPEQFGFLAWSGRRSVWERAESPFVLRDQGLDSKIMVKAVDKAGNERVVHYTPPQSILDHVTDLGFLLAFGILALIAFAAFELYRRFILPRRPEAEQVPEPEPAMQESETYDESHS